MFTITAAGIHISRTASISPDFNRGKMAAARILSLIDRKPRIDNLSEEGKIPQVSRLLLSRTRWGRG